jgi:hypothetical protein
VCGLAKSEFDLLPHEFFSLQVLRLLLVAAVLIFVASPFLNTSLLKCLLWVEAVGPAPAGYEIRFVCFEGGGDVLNVFFGGSAAADECEM